jgi:protein phosphatase
VLSSDFFRGLVSDDENDQAATGDAFDALYYMLAKRLARGRLTVVDATNVRPEDRKRLVEHARQYHCFAIAIVVNASEKTCLERNRNRPERTFGPHVVRRQLGDLKRGLRGLEREGFRYVHLLNEEEIASDQVEIRRVPLWNNKKDQPGPFDIFGDLHGCADEMESLLAQLGLERSTMEEPDPFWGNVSWHHPERRRAIFLGDLVDRGPRVLDTVRIARNMVKQGTALCIAGNHDVKLVRWLRGKQVQVKHGLEQSIAEIEYTHPRKNSQPRQSLSPGECLYDFCHDYSWLTSIYIAHRRRNRRALATHEELSVKTRELIQQHTEFMEIAEEVPVYKI